MKITKKIEEFDAIQYTGSNDTAIANFINLEVSHSEIEGEPCLTVQDPNGEWYVFIEQWVLRTIENREVLGTVDKDHFWDNFSTVDEPLD